MKRIKIKTQIPLLLFAVIAIFVFSCNETEEKNKKTDVEDTSSKTVSPQQETIADKNILVGEWTRTDAAYQIKITELLNDGTMKADYFNPKSINVASALWTFTDGVLKIYIELRDENYPGSNYTLTYLPDKDQLVGKYFQAVESATYNIAFTRKK